MNISQTNLLNTIKKPLKMELIHLFILFINIDLILLELH